MGVQFSPPGTIKVSDPVNAPDVKNVDALKTAIFNQPPVQTADTPEPPVKNTPKEPGKLVAKTVVTEKKSVVVTKEPVSDTPPSARKVASESVQLIAQIKKDKGDKTIIIGSKVPDVIRVPTGDFEFDFATGGGFPCGRYSIIYGPESSCKTNLTYLAIAEVQRRPEGEANVAILVDLEHTFDPNWAIQFGIDVDKLHVVKPGYGEEAVDIIDALVQAEDVGILVVDSLATVVASKEIDGSVEKMDVGTAPTLVKRLVNKVTISLSKEAKRDHYPCVIFINQTRFKIGQMFGNPETMPGGQTMKFLSSLTIRVQGKNKIIKEFNPDIPVVKEVSARIVKAKIGIVKSEFSLDMALMPHGNLSVGETDSWTTVKNELQAAGLLVNTNTSKGWSLDGKFYSKLSMIQDTYYAEKAFALHLQKMVIALYSGQKMVMDDTKKLEGEAEAQLAEVLGQKQA
jgi:recombination protein RecA